jgi:hypothetical protein
MRRLPISNRDLERTIHKAWTDLQQARRDDHIVRIVWHERLMNEALDELGARIGWGTPNRGTSAQMVA